LLHEIGHAFGKPHSCIRCLLLSGAKNSHMVTLMERPSRFAVLIKVPSRDTDSGRGHLDPAR
jgi:IS30 family transposase